MNGSGQVTGETPQFTGSAFLAVTETEVVLFDTKQGLMKQTVADELARLPRTQISRTDFKPTQLISNLTLNLVDGGAWSFDAPRVQKKGLEQIAKALGANRI